MFCILLSLSYGLEYKFDTFENYWEIKNLSLNVNDIVKINYSRSYLLITEENRDFSFNFRNQDGSLDSLTYLEGIFVSKLGILELTRTNLSFSTNYVKIEIVINDQCDMMFPLNKNNNYFFNDTSTDPNFLLTNNFNFCFFVYDNITFNVKYSLETDHQLCIFGPQVGNFVECLTKIPTFQLLQKTFRAQGLFFKYIPSGANPSKLIEFYHIPDPSPQPTIPSFPSQTQNSPFDSSEKDSIVIPVIGGLIILALIGGSIFLIFQWMNIQNSKEEESRKGGSHKV